MQRQQGTTTGSSAPAVQSEKPRKTLAVPSSTISRAEWEHLQSSLASPSSNPRPKAGQQVTPASVVGGVRPMASASVGGVRPAASAVRRTAQKPSTSGRPTGQQVASGSVGGVRQAVATTSAVKRPAEAAPTLAVKRQALAAMTSVGMTRPAGTAGMTRPPGSVVRVTRPNSALFWARRPARGEPFGEEPPEVAPPQSKRPVTVSCGEKRPAAAAAPKCRAKRPATVTFGERLTWSGSARADSWNRRLTRVPAGTCAVLAAHALLTNPRTELIGGTTVEQISLDDGTFRSRFGRTVDGTAAVIPTYPVPAARTPALDVHMSEYDREEDTACMNVDHWARGHHRLLEVEFRMYWLSDDDDDVIVYAEGPFKDSMSGSYQPLGVKLVGLPSDGPYYVAVRGLLANGRGWTPYHVQRLSPS